MPRVPPWLRTFVLLLSFLSPIGAMPGRREGGRVRHKGVGVLHNLVVVDTRTLLSFFRQSDIYFPV